MEIDAWQRQEPVEGLFVPEPPDAPHGPGTAAAPSLGARRLRIARKQRAPTPRRERSGAATDRPKGRKRAAKARGSKSSRASARVPKLPRMGAPAQAAGKTPRHQFMQRKSKSVPVAGHHMPRRVIKNSALVASISMHEKAFAVRKQAYAAQRKQRQQEEQEAAKIQFAEEEARREVRLLELRKQRVQGIVGQFGLDPEALHADELLSKELAAERLVNQRRMDAEAEKQRLRDEAAAAAERLRLETAAASMIQRFFRHARERRLHHMLLASVARAQEMQLHEEVELAMERLLNQVVRNDLDDRHPLLKEIEALEERNRASMREINRVLDAATSSHGTWAVQWPEELRGDEEGWSRDGGSRQFATGFIQYLLDDALMPHAKDRLVARQRQRVSARIEGRADLETAPASESDTDWAFLRKHREQNELEELRSAVMASFLVEPEPETQSPEDVKPALFTRVHGPHGIALSRGSKSSTATNRGSLGGGTAVCGKHVMSSGVHFADFYLKAGCSGVSVGVTRPSFDVHVDLGLASRFASASPKGWCFCANTGEVRHNGEESFWAGMERAKEGDHIGLLLNCEMGTLTAFKSEPGSDHCWCRLGVLESALFGDLSWMVELRRPGDAVKLTSAPVPIVRISKNQSDLEQMIAVALERGMNTDRLEKMLAAEKQLRLTGGTELNRTHGQLLPQDEEAINRRTQLENLERMVADATASKGSGHAETLALAARMEQEMTAEIMRAEKQRRVDTDSDEDEEDQNNDNGDGNNMLPCAYSALAFSALPLAIRKMAQKLQFTAESWPNLPQHAETAIFYDDLEEDEKTLALKLGFLDAASWHRCWHANDQALGDAEALYAEGWSAIAAHRYEAAIQAFEAGMAKANIAEDEELQSELQEGLQVARQNVSNRDMAHQIWVNAKAAATVAHNATQQVVPSAERTRKYADLVTAKQAEGEAAIAAHQYDAAVTAFEEAAIAAGETTVGTTPNTAVVLAINQRLEVAKAGREVRSRALLAWDTAKSTFDAASAAAYVRSLHSKRIAEHAAKKARVLLASGETSAAAGDYPTAIAFFHTALREQTNDRELVAQIRKAVAAAEWDMAEDGRNEAVARSKLAVGKLRLAENNLEPAIAAFEEALREKPADEELLAEVNAYLERATARHLNEKTQLEKRLRKQFQSLDKDSSGFLNEQELLEAVHANRDGNLAIAGLDPSSEEFHSTFAKLIESADKDKDGQINYEEFLAVLGTLEARNHLAKQPPDSGLTRDQLAITKIQAHVRGYLACNLGITNNTAEDEPISKRSRKTDDAEEELSPDFAKQQREMVLLMEKLHIADPTSEAVEENDYLSSTRQEQQQQRTFLVSAVVAKLLLTRQQQDESSTVPNTKRPAILSKPWKDLSAPLKAAAGLLKFGSESWPKLPLDSSSAVPYAQLNAHEQRVAVKLGLVSYWEQLLQESGIGDNSAATSTGRVAAGPAQGNSIHATADSDVLAVATANATYGGALYDSGSEQYEYETADEVDDDDEEEEEEDESATVDATPEQKENARVIAVNKYAEGQTALQAAEFNWASWAFEAGLAALSEPNIPIDGVFGEWTNKLKHGLLATEAGLNAVSQSRKKLAHLIEGINSAAFAEQLGLESPAEAALSLTRAKLAEGNTAMAAHEFAVASAAFESGIACMAEICDRSDVTGVAEEIADSGLKKSLYDGLQMTKAAVLARKHAHTAWCHTRDLVMAYEAHLNSDEEHFRLLSNLVVQAGLNPQILSLSG